MREKRTTARPASCWLVSLLSDHISGSSLKRWPPSPRALSEGPTEASEEKASVSFHYTNREANGGMQMVSRGDPLGIKQEEMTNTRAPGFLEGKRPGSPLPTRSCSSLRTGVRVGDEPSPCPPACRPSSCCDQPWTNGHK